MSVLGTNEAPMSHWRGWSAKAMAHPVRTLLIVYAVSRLIGWGCLWVAANDFQNPAGVGTDDPGVLDLLPLWDTEWYERIARHGYPVPLPGDPETGVLTYSEWAFYPLFPMILRALMALGVPFLAAGVLLNLVLGAASTVLIWATLRHGVHAEPRPERDRLALLAAVLWCFYPATTVMLKPYTEALAMVLIACSLLALLQRRYWVVVLLAVPLGLTRAVAPAMGLAVVVHLFLRWREDRQGGQAPLHGQRTAALAMVGLTGISGILWPAIAGQVSGIPTAFFDVQRAWGMQPSAGPFVLWLEWAWESKGAAGVIVLVGLVGTYIALVLGRHGRWIPVELRVWAVAYPLYLFAVVRPITSMWRFLLLDFPLAALFASVAMRTSTGDGIVRHWKRRVALLLALLVAGMVWWTATFLTYTPWGSRPP